jgi:hypothetical protein
VIQLHFTISISLRAVILALVLGVVLFTGSDVAKGAPLLADLPVDGNVVFTPSGQDGARDIHTTGNNGGMRFYNADTLTASPSGAAIQFFGNNSTGFPGQAFIDSGAHNSAAVILRTAPTNGPVTERMRVTADGKVGIGTATPNEQLELTGNLRLPTTTETAGIIRQGNTTLIHTFGGSNFFAGLSAGNFTMNGSANTAVGTAALLFNTQGTANTAVGLTALQANTTGSSNTGIGIAAGQLHDTDKPANTTGSNNTFIGAYTGVAGSTQLNNATAIGYYSHVGASNSLVLGGTGGNAVSVGIGTTTPKSTLQVVGGYIQFPVAFDVAIDPTPPPASDCDDITDLGRAVVQIRNSTAVLFICGNATTLPTITPKWEAH